MAGPAYSTSAFALLIYALSLWGINVPINDPTFVDAAWGPGFALQALVCLPIARWSFHHLLMTSIVSLWALRLSRHLYRRWRRYGPDRRYVQLLQRFGGNPIITSLWTIFLPQAAAMWIMGMPIQYAAAHRARLTFGKLLGSGIAVAGLLIESLADWQLSKFLATNKDRNRVMDQGLWRYSRHPNYFGDAMFWWGMYMYCAPSWTHWTIIGPIALTSCLLFVTGVPTVEGSLSRRAAYQDYIRRTSAFIPWFPADLSHYPASSSATSNIAATVSNAASNVSDTVRGVVNDVKESARDAVRNLETTRDTSSARDVDSSLAHRNVGKISEREDDTLRSRRDFAVSGQ